MKVSITSGIDSSTRRTAAHCLGLTLVELLVVLFIVGLLFSLILPAVQQSREAGRRITCANNLKQIGAAVMEFESAKGTLPTTKRGYSALVQILPYLEQAPLAVSLDLDGPAAQDGSLDRLLGKQVITTYLCPSDIGLGRSMGSTNYAMNTGNGRWKYGDNGPFHFQKPALRDITDGLSQTVAFSEWTLGSRNEKRPDPGRDTIMLPETSAEGFDEFAAACDGWNPIDAGTRFNVDRGYRWYSGTFGSSRYNHVLPIGHHSCWPEHTMSGSAAWTAGSWHPGGAHALFVDGHVKFLPDTISLQVWRALGSRNGGEIEQAP